jgi:hypothetical protein
MSTVHSSKGFLIWTLLIAALVAPIADVAAFGIHDDHISMPETNGGDPTEDPGIVLVVEVPPPLDQVAALDVPPSPPRGSQPLSVPLSPPRS